ncbi:MAG TPA: transglutaminase family protein, partial [Candidatus Hydrogenedentes bacterium]|nr:transglutaminase family protein [Candidatus Hydrogenedentota bacterium]
MRIDLDPLDCLEPTGFMNFEHPDIQACLAGLHVEGLTAKDKAVRLFNFVRDGIEYEFLAKLERHEYAASHVLALGRGFCVQKAVLLCALGRAAGLPTAIVMTDLRDRTLPARVVEAIGTDTLLYHGLTAFYLGG